MPRPGRLGACPQCRGPHSRYRRVAGRLLILPALVTAVAMLLGCGDANTPRPDVLLITVDTLRADHVGAYGSGSHATPMIDAFAEEAVVFERAIAAASRTVPAHASMMTSQHTRGHSVGHGNGDTTLADTTTLAELFRAAGYRTGAFVSNILLTRGTGLNAGFETFDDDLVTPELNRPHVVERLAGDTTDRAIAWLESDDDDGDRPRFLWVHYQDPHGPYTPPSEDLALFEADAHADERELPIGTSNRSRGVIPPYQVLPDVRRPSAYRARYAGEVHYADREIGRLLAHAESSGTGRPFVVMFTADHGESLGEARFHFMHTHTTTPDVAHVPLILRAPGLAPGHVDGTVGHVDVMPTLLDLARIPAPADVAGVALADVARGETALPPRFLYCDIGTQLSAYDDEGFVRAAGLAGPWKVPGSPSAEVSDVKGQRYRWKPRGMWRADGPRGAPLPEAVIRYAERATAMTPLERPDPELGDQLRALGYVDD